MNNSTQYAEPNLERRMLSYFVRFDSNTLLRLEYFTILEARNLFSFIEKNKIHTGTFEELWDLWEISLKRQNKKLERHYKFLQMLFAEDKVPTDKVSYLLEQLRGFAQARALYDIYNNSLTKFKEGDPNSAVAMLENGLSSISDMTSDEVISRGEYVSDFRERYEKYLEIKAGKTKNKIPTGIRKFDMKVNGVPRSTLNLIQGESSKGKTFILMELAYQSLLQGFPTLFITVEMRREEIETRWDTRITGFNNEKFSAGLTEEEEGFWRKRIRDIKKAENKGGRLAVSYIPEGGTTKIIEREIEYWENKWKQKIMLVAIDYADLLASHRKSFSQEEQIGYIFRDLKRLSQMSRATIWTVSQFGLKSYGKASVDMGDTAYSAKKNHWSNLVLNIGGSKDDRDNEILRIFVSKNTFGKRGQEIILYTDFSKSLIDIINDKGI